MGTNNAGADNTTPVLYIPYEGEPDQDQGCMPPLTQDDEILEQVRLRLDAYHRAWLKCLQSLQSSIRSQHEAMVRDVVNHVRAAYAEKTVKIPFQELPVVCIQSSLSGSSILEDISSSLDEDEDERSPAIQVLKVHLYASDCPNVMGGMKSIITNLTERLNVLESVKRKPSTSSANYDIEMLVAWYTALSKASQNASDALIVVIMHDFEQFDPTVVQDIFYIFSQNVSRLRCVFLVSLSSPVSPSFLHLAYPKSTLALLCMDTFVAPPGYTVLESALQNTFFNVEFDPDLSLGPKTFEQIVHFIKRNSISQDTFLTSIQLVHLRHFLLNPLSLVAQETPSAISSPGSLHDIVTRRLKPTNQVNGRKSPTKRHAQKDIAHVTAINQARTNFKTHFRKMRLQYGLVQFIYGFVKSQEFEDRKLPQVHLTDLMLETLRGKVHKYIQRLAPFVRNLDECQFVSLLAELDDYFEQPSLVKSEKKAREEIANFLSLLVDKAKTVEHIVSIFSDWLEDYIADLTTRLDDLPLWDVWYTGDAPFPSEFLNPSSRASVLSGLLRPHDYGLDMEAPSANEKEAEIWRLPDISILFTRYMESGKMINVYDWFESFQVALEAQREHVKEQESKRNHSPSKRGAKRKAPSNDSRIAEVKEEMWKVEVQARFMCALHGLDYLGFIKHTGRKADHVLRTVFDVGD